MSTNSLELQRRLLSVGNSEIEELGTGVRAAVEYAAEVHGNALAKKKIEWWRKFTAVCSPSHHWLLFPDRQPTSSAMRWQQDFYSQGLVFILMSTLPT